MTAMLRVLEVLAGIGFVCSATLASCIISLWMRREVRQVGIMKTLGARSAQLAAQYLALVTPVVLLAVALAVPIGVVVSRWVVKYHQTLLNIDVGDWAVPRTLLLRELVFALALPVLRHGAANLPGRPNRASAKRSRILGSSRRAARSGSPHVSCACRGIAAGRSRCATLFAAHGGSRLLCSRFRPAGRFSSLRTTTTKASCA